MSPYSYSAEAVQAAYPLGGIGTGTISLGSRGNLQDWEIFNRPDKGNHMPDTFFAIRVQKAQGAPDIRVLESEPVPPYASSNLLPPSSVMGLPRFQKSRLTVKRPFAQVVLTDEAMPVSVTMEAFTPFIPLNVDDSGIPVIILRYKVKNCSKEPIDVTIAGTLTNMVGFQGYDAYGNLLCAGTPLNTPIQKERCQGICFTNSELTPDTPLFGSMALATADKNAEIKAHWQTTGHRDALQDFLNQFLRGLPLKSTGDFAPDNEKKRIGSLFIRHELLADEDQCFEFFLSWHFPLRPFRWEGTDTENEGKTVQNHYAVLFRDAWDVTEYTIKHLERLEHDSRSFSRALYGSTLPEEIIEAISRNITPLCSNTCFLLADGTFLAWEGCNNHSGSCFGTCTHVWNYAQTAAFLFPTLEQSARRNELLSETDNDGQMAYRTRQVFGLPKFDGPPAADGQMGVIVRAYREWKLSGDDTFLREVWEKVTKALDFPWKHWDTDGDMLFDAPQHTTYDIDFCGPNPLTAIMALAALKASSEMAKHLKDFKHQEQYEQMFRACSEQIEAQLWNGRFYAQRIDGEKQCAYQFGAGCLSDQLMGQFMAWSSGLGDILPKGRIHQTLKSIYENNYQSSLRESVHIQRTFALPQEPGLLLCTWPDGGRPDFPFVYSDEVWTGVEYEVASLLLHEGMIDEGLNVVRSVLQRYDGIRRNPWDEIECGHHYARSMSSWSLLLALCGFQVQGESQAFSFSPVIHQEHFDCFFSTGQAWGILHQRIDEAGHTTQRFEVLYGTQRTALAMENVK